MRHTFYLVIAISLMLISSFVWAVRVSSIYQATIPVASQSDLDKKQAAQDGLARVLIKVSGNNQIMESYPFLKTALTQADVLAQQYSYSKNFLTIRYDVEGVNRLLREAAAPIWGQNRPLILVLLALESPDHPLDIIDSSNTDIQTLLKQAAKDRGLPIILPMMDMTDLNQIATADVVAKAIPKLQLAVKRYVSNAILIGHVTQTSEDINSEWLLVAGKDQINWTISGKSLAEIFTGVMNEVTDTLASHYAAIQTDVVQSQVVLRITGIKQQADLMKLMKYLQHFSQVSDVQLASVVGNQVTLNISLRSGKQSFTQAIAVGKNLTPIKNSDTLDDTLLYEWMP